jgi:hypothetical protein
MAAGGEGRTNLEEPFASVNLGVGLRRGHHRGKRREDGAVGERRKRNKK